MRKGVVKNLITGLQKNHRFESLRFFNITGYYLRTYRSQCWKIFGKIHFLDSYHKLEGTRGKRSLQFLLTFQFWEKRVRLRIFLSEILNFTEKIVSLNQRNISLIYSQRKNFYELNKVLLIQENVL